MSRPRRTSKQGKATENLPPTFHPPIPRPHCPTSLPTTLNSRNTSRKRKKASKPRRNRRHDFWTRAKVVPMVLKGTRIEPLKTFNEVNAEETLVDAFVIEIPVTLANSIVSIFKPLLIAGGSLGSMHHLRRLVNFPHLPQRFREKHGVLEFDPETIFFILPRTQVISLESIASALKPHVLQNESPTNTLPRIFTSQVPGHAPKTIEKAKLWSEEHWPCIFNPASHVLQEAPPLTLLRTTLTELDTENCDQYMALANNLAQETSIRKLGRQVGAIIVDPIANEVVAAAGDARWWQQATDNDGGNSGCQTEGRPEHHALMRAIAMVAAKELRRRTAEGLRSASPSDRSRDLEGQPLTPIESFYRKAPDECAQDASTFATQPIPQSKHRQDPYLCNGLDVYLTHEPCICCSMALVHSRFRTCVFRTRMPGTGGISAETEDGGLGYGLFWRKELNWRLMAFQYTGITPSSGDDASQGFHA